MAKKKLAISLKPIKLEILKAEKTLRGFKSKVSAADGEKIDLKIEYLSSALKEVAKACKNSKMTPGFSPSNN